jgi:hypothetical protein
MEIRGENFRYDKTHHGVDSSVITTKYQAPKGPDKRLVFEGLSKMPNPVHPNVGQ